MSTKKIFIISAVIIAAVVIYVLATNKLAIAPVVDNPNPSANVSNKEKVEKQPAATVLAAFPDGFPTEAGAESSSGYKYTPAKSTEQQSTLEYNSSKSLSENAKIFKDYLAAQGFKISNTINEKDLVFYYAAKDNNDLSIKIKQTSSEVTVSATYLKR